MASGMRPSARDIERRKWQNPEAILTEIGLEAGDTFVDIGCGQGYFTIPAARIVGNKGKVYALDSNLRAIDILNGNAETAGLKNIISRVGLAEHFVMCEACADSVFYGIVLHDFEDREAVLKNAVRMLKKSGKLIDLDFKKIEMPFGPPVEIKLSEEEAKRLIKGAGFKVKSLHSIEPYSYLLIAGLE
jgi:ubiquinone/menaquinone biosynthesis C-methylase UbiE